MLEENVVVEPAVDSVVDAEETFQRADAVAAALAAPATPTPMAVAMESDVAAREAEE